MSLLDAERRAPGLSPLRLVVFWFVPSSILLLIGWTFYRFRRQRRDRIPRTGPIIYASNHQSHFDPVSVGLLSWDRPCTYLARASLFTFKPFGAMIRAFHSIPLERSGNPARALRTAIDVVKRGRVVVIFPEGTRTRDGALREFKNGILLLARRTGAPVVPVATEGAYDVWPHGRRFPRPFGRVLVRAGEPIPAAELRALAPEEAMDRIKRAIETLRLELRAELRAKTGGRVPKPGPGDVAYWERDADAGAVTVTDAR